MIVEKKKFILFRDPGFEYKEDWTSVTMAALAGGIVTIFAMPNTRPSLIDEITYDEISKRATSMACCDYALYAGATTTNMGQVNSISYKVIGLKMYLNETFTNLSLINRLDVWRKHFEVIFEQNK